jgi:hypothetical protein
VVLVGAAVVRPEWAPTALHLLVASVVVTISTVAIAERLTDLPARPATAFVPADRPEPPSVETPDVGELVRLVAQSGGTIPAPILQRLRAVCRGRLADDHRLQLDRPDDAAAAGAIVGDHVRALLATGDEPELPMRSLPRLLDEVEQL